MAKRQGGSGFIYASIPLDMTDELHDLESEKPGTVGALTLAFMDYAKAHAKDTTAPDTVPEAPEGFSLAARHVWTRLINTHNGRIGSYISQVEGGKKAQPGPGRPKGSKNKPKATADTGSEDSEDQEADPATDIPPDDIRITGESPWLPSEKAAQEELWAAAVRLGIADNTFKPTVYSAATQLWARLRKCGGYLAPHGMGGIDLHYVEYPEFLLLALTSKEDFTPEATRTKAAHFWRLLDAWAMMRPPVYVDLYTILNGCAEDTIMFCGDAWQWKDNPERRYAYPEELLTDINESERIKEELRARQDAEYAAQIDTHEEE